MVTLPIGSYFCTVNTIFNGNLPFPPLPFPAHAELKVSVGNSTFAGALAAIIANVVLVGYVVAAMREDQSERLAEEEKAKKAL
jgi:pseudouridine-5'-phosphate glycosidase